jgi:hypothetical protein
MLARMIVPLLLAVLALEKAPELQSSDVWINADRPLKLSSLKERSSFSIFGLLTASLARKRSRALKRFMKSTRRMGSL